MAFCSGAVVKLSLVLHWNGVPVEGEALTTTLYFWLWEDIEEKHKDIIGELSNIDS
jgi:hypothetical protein